MAVAPESDRAIKLAVDADGVLEDYRSSHADASLSVDIDESLALSVEPRILTIVLDNLIENALLHNDAPTPVVTVCARITDGGVDLYVTDNGPGIPDHERAVVEAGDEDALEHGRGLGLWVVKWGVVRLGGELSFSDNQPPGTVVTIHLPAGAESEPPTASNQVEARAERV